MFRWQLIFRQNHFMKIRQQNKAPNKWFAFWFLLLPTAFCGQNHSSKWKYLNKAPSNLVLLLIVFAVTNAVCGKTVLRNWNVLTKHLQFNFSFLVVNLYPPNDVLQTKSFCAMEISSQNNSRWMIFLTFFSCFFSYSFYPSFSD